RNLLLRHTDKALAHPLLLAALTQAVNHEPAFEHLLTAMRRVLLLEALPARFEDKTLYSFAVALSQQCFNNEYVWAVAPAETSALAELAIDWDALEAGNPAASRALLLHMLYSPPHVVVAEHLTAEAARAIRPRMLADVVYARLAEEAELSALAADIPVICSAQDETSVRVARQYETSPYPRWNSVFIPPKASAERTLSHFLPPEKLTFLHAPFKVLVAGAGTGQHAIAVAERYGDNADVLAVDLSRRSLAYGRAKASKLGVNNLRFAGADIRAIPPEEAGPFDIIESVGVLHHLADPFAGWQALLRLLRPGGLMAVGFYSATARKPVAKLRGMPDYPGAGCSDDAARNFRAELMASPEKAGGLLRSHDFYALSNFRDLLLHEHEHPVTLPEIEVFLRDNGLVFRGFSIPQPLEGAFAKMFPDDSAPGTLANWAAFEEKHPQVFETMYQFWCEKV
ncbi:MAG: class I SAM-dependent methyltransferase, partial [Alphaproteobacteria bacterium]